MKKNLILLSIITFGFAYNGSITGVTYFDYTCENDASTFNFNRQYFNYAIEMSNDIKLRIVFDAGRTNELDEEDSSMPDIPRPEDHISTLSLEAEALLKAKDIMTDDISKFVDVHPESAAKLIRTWLAKDKFINSNEE